MRLMVPVQVSLLVQLLLQLLMHLLAYLLGQLMGELIKTLLVQQVKVTDLQWQTQEHVGCFLSNVLSTQHSKPAAATQMQLCCVIASCASLQASIELRALQCTPERGLGWPLCKSFL